MKRKAFIAGCALATVAAGALAVALLLASPAAAVDLSDGDGRSLKPWDTDNLRYASGQYNAMSFNIPFHEYEYGGYSGVAACQSGVADAFFQTGGTVGAVNDFPYLDWDNDSGS